MKIGDRVSFDSCQRRYSCDICDRKLCSFKNKIFRKGTIRSLDGDEAVISLYKIPEHWKHSIITIDLECVIPDRDRDFEKHLNKMKNT